MMPALTHAPVQASAPPRWYRFHIDCSAPENKEGVSLKSLVKEADAQRKKAKLSAAAAASSAAIQTTPTAAAAAAAATAGAAAGLGTPGPINTTATPAGASLEGATAIPGAPTNGGSSSSGGGGASSGAGAPGSVATAAMEGLNPNPGQQQQQEQEEEQELRAGGLSSRGSRGRGLLDLIERLELEHRGGTPMVASSSEGSISGDDENENDSEADDDSSDTASVIGVVGGGGGSGSGGSGSETAVAGQNKSKPKAKRKVAKRHSLDYEDPFIDDTLLVEAYYAKEAASKVKTVHTGFFANQGPVATVGSPGGGSDAGGDDGSEADSEVMARPKKKKPKATQAGEAAGKGGGPAAPAKKKRKTPAEAGGTKKVPKVGGGAADPPPAAAATTIATTTNGGSHTDGASGAAIIAPAGNGATAPDGEAPTAASAAVPATSAGVALPGAASVIGQAVGAPSGQPGEALAAVLGAGNSGSVGTSSGGGGVVSVAPTGAAGWTAELEGAVSLFEQDCKGWIDSGRPAGDGAQAVLQAMGALDALVRRSTPDVHGKGPYLERLSAVYGQPQASVKTILATLKEREDKPESARLREAYKALRSTFETNLDLSVKASGSPPTLPFAWSDLLRLSLHDMLRAFEAWIAKEYGGRLTKKSIDAMKNIFDELTQKWPAEMNMTADEVKRLYTNEKRRIRTKANKEAAPSGSPMAAAAAAGRASPSPPLQTPAPTTTLGVAGAVAAPVAVASSPVAAAAPVAVVAPAAAAVPVAAVAPVAQQAPAAPVAPAAVARTAVAGPGASVGSPNFVNLTDLGPPRGARFDSPPVFDHRAFEEEEEDEISVVG